MTQKESDADRVLQRSLRKAMEALGADKGLVHLLDADSQQLVLHAHQGLSSVSVSACERLNVGECMPGTALRRGRSILVEDPTTDPQATAGIPKTEEYSSSICSPLRAEGEDLGTITLLSAKPEHFTSADARLLKAVAKQMGIGMESRRRLAAKERRLDELAALHDIRQAISSTLQLDELLDLMRQQASVILKADLHVALYDEKNDELKLLSPHEKDQRSEPVSCVLGAGLTEYVIHGRRPLVINHNLPKRARKLGIQVTGSPCKSWLGVPMVAADKAIGMLYIQDYEKENAYDQRHVEILSTIANQAAMAIDKARLYAAEQRRAQESALLLDIAQAVNSSLDLTRVLKLVAQKTAQICDVERCSILLLDKDKEDLMPMMSQFASGAADPELWRIFNEETYAEKVDAVPAIRQVIRDRKTVILDEESKSRLPERWTDPFGIKSVLLVPLTSRDEAIGLMALDYTKEGLYFSAEQVDLASTIGSQVAIAIENARLFGESDRRAQEVLALLEVSQAVSSTLDLEAVLETIGSRAKKLLDVDTSCIFLLDKKNEKLMPCIAIDPYAEQVLATPLEVGKGITGWVAQTGIGQVVNHAELDPRCHHVPGTPPEPECLLSAPLLSKDEVIGVMTLSRLGDREFEQEDLRLLITLASQAAIAIENASLYAETQRRLKESNTLQEISRLVNSSLEPGQIFQTLVETVGTGFGYSMVSIYTVEEEALRLRSQVGCDSAHAPPVLALDEGVAGRVARTGQPELIPDVTQHPDVVWAAPEVTSAITVPIKQNDLVLGILNVESTADEPLTDTDLNLISSISHQVSVGIQNARLYEQERKKVAQLQAINEAGQEISSVLQLDEMLSRVVRLVQETFDCYNSNVFLVDDDCLFLAAGYGGYESGKAPVGSMSLRIGEGIIGWVAEHGEPLPVSDVSSEPKYRPCHLLPKTRSELAVPIRGKEGTLGVLDIQSTELCAFDQTDLGTLCTLADQLSIGIENARLYESERKRAAQLSVMNEVGRRTASILVLDELLQETVTAIRDEFNYPFVSVLVVNEDAQEAEQRAEAGLHSYMKSPNYRQSIGEGLIGWVIRNGKPLMVNDVSKDPRYLEGFPARPFTKAELVVPIKAEGRVVAVLDTQSAQVNAFEETDLVSMETIADQLSVAMRNAQLFEQVTQGEQEWEDTFRAITDGIAICDVDLRILRANPALAGILGISREELIGQQCREVFPCCRGATSSCPQRRALDTGQPASTEVEDPVLDRTFHISCSPVFAEGGESKGTVHTIRDVSQEKLLRAQLVQTEKLAAIGELVSGVAHELNNPLTSVMGYAQLLQTADVSKETRNDLRRIYQEAQRSAKIIENLLTFARKERAEKRYIDINQVLRDTLKLRSYQFRVDNIELIAELDEHLPWTMGAPHQLQQVFLNLINNAHQAMLEYQGGGRLTVRSEQDGQIIRVKVIDDGPGISQEVIDNIFDPFFTTKDVGRGTGLGLSIAFGILQAHNGRIWADSEPGKGATFTVELPIVQEPPEPPQEERPREEAQPHTGRKILVIDDEERILELISRVLEGLGHQVVTVDGGERAMESMGKERYDLVICDVRMPGMGGQELYRQVKSKHPDLAEHVLFTTGDTVSESTRAFLRSVGTPHISKPFKIEQLQKAIERVLQREEEVG